MRTPRMALVVLLAAGVALTGCGGDDADVTGPPAVPTSSPTDPATPSPSASPASVAPSTSPAGPVPPGASVPPGGPKLPGGGPKVPPGPGATELTGTVESGVEPGCLLLDGHQLVGGPKDVLVVGARVSVTGRAQPDLMSTCQQGVPFVVESARRS
ncbi:MULTISPECIES: hypothetical protein [Micromonospora]|uniref:Uncharacterized protein n=1 Tax=Micromonospora antibiotica TaxID=2807623 RepID=A0ABS3VBL5_9ACTN|nr:MULTISPECIES: hypothetical protein [Micromonospora]MBO4162974.1 hypothetical protein [Micromonospora antibiotica]MBW4704881.1 hypothetical protein [Micromonospora sp. RL09-050-HVF-A]